MRLPSAFRTAAFRLTAVYAVLFGVSLAVILAIVITLVDRSMRDQLAASAREDAVVLARSYQLGQGTGAASIDRPRGSPAYFFVRRRNGAELMADFRPPGSPLGSFEVDDTSTNRDGEQEPANTLIGYGIQIGDGSYIAAARDDEPILETMEAILEAATAAGVLALTLAIVGGLLMSALSLRRVDSLDRAARAIFDGDLSRRMPVRGTHDEFDRLATSLNRMLDRIAILMDGLRQVSTDVAHDLRTPLSHLRQRLEDFGKTELNEEQRSALEGAQREADSILSIFGALLQIAQVEGGSLKGSFVTLDLALLAKETGEIYQAVAEGAGHLLEVETETRADVRGNRELLVQMIVNLLENAITHTPAGTRIQLNVQDKAGAVVLTVADNGPGIPCADRERVFRRFYRLDASRSTPGTGLGLALVAAIAEAHDVKVDTTDNGPGLRITLTFPKR